MEGKRLVNTTEQLRLGLLKRVALLLFGCIASMIVGGMLPLLYMMPLRSEVAVGERIRPMQEAVSPAVIIAPIFYLVVVGVLIYGIYDFVRAFMRYRKSQQEDQQLFP